MFQSYTLILTQTKEGIRVSEAYLTEDLILTPDTLTETAADEQLRQLSRMYPQKTLIFAYRASEAEFHSEPEHDTALSQSPYFIQSGAEPEPDSTAANRMP